MMVNYLIRPTRVSPMGGQQSYWRILLVALLLSSWLLDVQQPLQAAVVAQADDNVIYSTDDRFTAPLDQPFALRPKQSAEIEGEDLLVELFYWDESSGCVDAACQEFEITAALYSKFGEMQVTTSFSTLITPEEPYLVELENYDIWVLNLQEAADGSPLLVIQVVRKGGGTAGATENTDSGTDAPAADEFAPRYVDQCDHFSQFDAAAVLQEPVNEAEPIGNLSFGPLSEDFATSEMQGFCGYTNATPVERDTLDRSQTHLLTDLPYAHAVAVAHLPATETMINVDGTPKAGWHDLSALVNLIGAGGPHYDHEQMTQMLSTTGPVPPFLGAIYTAASDKSQFMARYLKSMGSNESDDLVAGEEYNELLWVWQPLPEGYFSLLLARTLGEYDLVIARLGSQVNEANVLGYSRVILSQVRTGAIAQAKHQNKIPTSLGCEMFNADVTTVVGYPVIGQAEGVENSVGCQFEIDAEQAVPDPAAASSNLDDYGMSVFIIPSQDSQVLLSGLVNAWATSSKAADPKTIEAAQALIENGDYAQAIG